MDQQAIQAEMIRLVKEVKAKKPLAGSVTNTVSMELVANIQIAIGGSPAIVFEVNESLNLAKSAEAMYLNMGTYIPLYNDTFPQTADYLYKQKKAWVLDPVGTNSSYDKIGVLKAFKAAKPSIIRANASETIILADMWDLLAEGTAASDFIGVDSQNTVAEAEQAAIALAGWTGGVVAVSGEVDYITDGQYAIRSYGGSPLLTSIIGSGDSLAGAMAVYTTQTDHYLISALAATAVFNYAGKKAALKAEGPGTFTPLFLDAVYQATAEEIADNPFELERVGA